jgi:transcriptional regulator with XRE-family HTH domain
MSWEKLGAAVRDRRCELGFTQADLAARGGPSVLTVRAIENNRAGRLSPRLRRSLERVLSWQSGSIEAILDGGTATLVEPMQQVTVGQLFDLAQRVLALLKAAVRTHGADASEVARTELTAVARETETTILELMPHLDDTQRGKAVELLAELRTSL